MQHSAKSLAERCQEYEARSDDASVGPFYSASATEQHVGGLFARACVVVEGPTEALALPVLLGAVGADLLGLGVAVVPAGGIGAIARWLRLYWAYDIPALAIFDRDQSDDVDWSKRAELLATLREERDDYERLVQQGQPISMGNA